MQFLRQDTMYLHSEEPLSATPLFHHCLSCIHNVASIPDNDCKMLLHVFKNTLQSIFPTLLCPVILLLTVLLFYGRLSVSAIFFHNFKAVTTVYTSL